MAYLTACPHGITLPYSSLFNVSLRAPSGHPQKSTPSEYYLNKATDVTLADASPQNNLSRRSDDIWKDPFEPSITDTEEVSASKKAKKSTASRAKVRFARLRRIAFRAFNPKADNAGNKNHIVSTTEIIYRQDQFKDSDKHDSDNPSAPKRIRIFNSLKFKSRGTKRQVKKMAVVLKDRISSSSPPETHPKTWEEFAYLYANEQIDIHQPPLPRIESENDAKTPSAVQSRFYSAPPPSNENVRLLVLNRLGVLGDKPFDATDEGAANWKKRGEIGDKLMDEGKAPSSLDESWEGDGSSIDVGQPSTTLEAERSVDFPPKTLEQHPVFRKMVKLCRQLFGAQICILSVLDDDRQVFLAESGLGELQLDGMREVTRGITFCAHTLLSGRKGFAVLDAHKDWRFENGPLVQAYGCRFYAGVPLMAPNLDGSQEAEEKSLPIGTLCLLDLKPRESFGVEERKKLVYLAEYARREIEKWFAKKMQHKMKLLEASQTTWSHELQSINSSQSGGYETLESELSSNQSDSKKMIHAGPTSIESTLSSPAKIPTKIRTGLFEDADSVLKPKMRKVFDLATKLVGETLDLSLVYLTAVMPYEGMSELGQTMIISGHNLPFPLPVFDAGLHLRALRAPEGGLLYQNPSLKESEEAALQPKTDSVQPQDQRANPYASAMIIAVGTEAARGGGFVLAGYTSDPLRVFGAEDVAFMQQFAQELTRYTSKLQL